jgi:hypothetical protein
VVNSPLEVNRADLSWALGACLPHTGRRELDFVGFDIYTQQPDLNVYATDGYTIAVAAMLVSSGTSPSQAVAFALSKKEARDLLSFVRPTLKRHHTELVQLLVVRNDPCGDRMCDAPDCLELHVLLPGVQSESEALTEVYEAQLPGKDFQSVYGVIEKIKRQAVETAHSLPFHPDTFARFAKAARYETDRLNLSPRQSEGFSYGASYITVGDNFEGAIAGLSYDLPAQIEENAA